MNTRYTIKNFRVFNSEGATFELAPVTILTGPNGSGKSSLVKSMVLLESYLEGIREDIKYGRVIDLNKYKLDFSKRPNSLLGNFFRVTNTKTKDSPIVFEYEVHSKMLGENVKVSLTFSIDTVLNDGGLSNVSFYKSDGSLIFSSDRVSGTSYNFNLIVNNFIRFTYGKCLVKTIREYENGSMFGQVSEKELEDISELIKIHRSDFESKFGKNSFIDIISHINVDHLSQTSDLSHVDSKKEMKLISTLSEKKTLFYIPIMDSIGKCDCSSLKGMIQQFAKSSYHNDILVSFFIDRIVADFKKTKCTNFSAYFLKKESEFLLNTKKSKTDPNMYFGFLSRSISDVSFQTQQLDPDAMLEDILLDENEINGMKLSHQKEISGDRFIKEWEKQNPNVDFEFIYKVLMDVNAAAGFPRNCDYYSYDDYFGAYRHKLLSIFEDYIDQFMKAIFSVEIPNSIFYFGSSTVDVRKFYTLDSDDVTSNLLNKYIETKRLFTINNHDIKFKPGEFINKWIKIYEIADHVNINIDTNGFGVTVSLFKSEADKKGKFLFEEGYGVTQLFFILLRIEIAIMESKPSFIPKSPFEMRLCLSEKDMSIIYHPSIIAIEEPEVHLHPKFQSKLADMFLEAYKKWNIHFIVETHSEYLIRRTQVLVSEMKYANNSESVEKSPFITYYLPVDGDKPYSLGYRKDGKFMKSFGPGFFDEALNQAFGIL